MKLLVLVFCLFVIVVSSQKYTTKYDNIDVNQIIKNERLLSNYVKCLLDTGRCGPDGQELRTNIEDALKTNCSKCSERQRSASRTIIRFLLRNKRDWWNQLEAKYDPSRVYLTKYADELRNEGINI